ncbi:PDDEXK nuclease domain-containing protein, partial [Enterococcus faecalis]
LIKIKCKFKILRLLLKKTLKNNSTFLEVGETMNKDKMVLQNTDIGKDNHQFDDIVKIVESAKDRAYRKVNEELILMYQEVGKYISEKSKEAGYGSNFVENVADFFSENYPDLKGFTRRGLYRMRQFYELYKDDEKVSTLLTQLSWSNHLKIMSGSKSKEEREFYINLAIKENLTHRELVRQMDSGYYERYMLSNSNDLPAIQRAKQETHNLFMDSYVLEFLDAPKIGNEREFQKSILQNLKNFILEIGKDFSFIGNEYRVQVGNHDYYVDLLFYHRGLSCLVAFELKIGEFKPEYIGKMNLYLEALDREVKKQTENPSVGVILCASKDDEVVEFALSRSLSPTMVSEYTLKLIDKNLLQRKLKEYVDIAEETNE